MGHTEFQASSECTYTAWVNVDKNGSSVDNKAFFECLSFRMQVDLPYITIVARTKEACKRREGAIAQRAIEERVRKCAHCLDRQGGQDWPLRWSKHNCN